MSYFPKPSLNENDLAIIERGATAAHSIDAGQYVTWHGKTGKAKAAILQGATLSDSLFDYDEEGVLNASINKVAFVDVSSGSISDSISVTVDITSLGFTQVDGVMICNDAGSGLAGGVGMCFMALQSYSTTSLTVFFKNNSGSSKTITAKCMIVGR